MSNFFLLIFKEHILISGILLKNISAQETTTQFKEKRTRDNFDLTRNKVQKKSKTTKATWNYIDLMFFWINFKISKKERSQCLFLNYWKQNEREWKNIFFMKKNASLRFLEKKKLKIFLKLLYLNKQTTALLSLSHDINKKTRI